MSKEPTFWDFRAAECDTWVIEVWPYKPTLFRKRERFAAHAYGYIERKKRPHAISQAGVFGSKKLVGFSREEAHRLMRESISAHIERANKALDHVTYNTINTEEI